MNQYPSDSSARLICLLCLILSSATTALAAEPEIRRLEPQGGQRGTEVEVKVFGVRLADQPRQVLFYEPGIELSKIEAVDAKQAKCVFNIADDCRIGRHALRLRTSTGLTNLMTFHVGSMKEVLAADSTEPQAIENNVVVNGVIKQGETDVFVVEVNEGDRLSVEIEAIRLGRTLFDPLIELRDEEQQLLVTSDDQPAAQQDAFVSMIAKKTGKIFVHVREVAYRGNDASTYRLHVGNFPRPVAVYPPAAMPGQAAELHWIGDTSGSEGVRVAIPETDKNVYEVLATDEFGISPSGIPMLMCDAPPVLEIEPNNNRDQATEILAPGVACGVISAAKDKDFFRFQMKKGEAWDFRVRARELRSPLDAVIHVFGPDGKYLKGNDDDRGQPDSYLRFKAPQDGEYTIDVEDRQLRGRKEMVYAVDISKPKPAVDLVLEERRRWFAHVVNIPQGNRAAAMMTVRRKDMGGPIELDYHELPTGVTVEAPLLAKDFHRVPVLFTANQGALLHSTRPLITAKVSDDPLILESRFRQQTWLVRGRNNVHVWSHYADRPAIAVTKELPYSVRIVEPKAPLVQGGSMELKVVAERDEGFENSLSIRTLYNPPGVSTNQSRSITKGSTEARIPMTANGKARVGKWKIVFVGRTNINGAVECATQLATIRIAEPYFDVKIPSLTVRRGQTVEMTVGLTQRHRFEGNAELQLIRLPSGVTAEKSSVTADGESAVFQLKVAEDARLGRHRGVGCQVQLHIEGEPVRYSQGYVDMFVDPAAQTETASNANESGGQAS